MPPSNDNKTLLIVDDEPVNILFLTEILEEHFKLIQVADGKSALSAIKEYMPDLILLDIVMPDINGLEVCKILKNEPDYSHIPVIFLSALDQISDRIAGYNAGGEDYISKPFSGLEVLTKIKMVLDKQQQYTDQKQLADNNMQMAMTLMSQNGETGQVLHFLKDSFLSKNIDELCQLLLNTCSAYELKVAIRINTNTPQYYTHDESIKKLDQQILDMLHARERLIYFENRCLVNFPHISLLIKNMPVHDDDKNGRLKDNIALVMEGADARMISLQNESKLSAREEGLAKMLSATKTMLNEINDNFESNAQKNTEIMTQLAKQIEWNFVQLGLSDEQEVALSEIVEKAINDSSSLYQSGLHIDDKLDKLTAELAAIIKP